MSIYRVIYIPGLGDHRSRGQELAVQLWRIYGVKSEMVRMHWRDGKPFAPKLEALLHKIDSYVAQGDTVSLVAASAGASVALAAFAARPQQIQSIALICGKVLNPQNMHPSVFRNNVSFKDSLGMVNASLSRLTVQDRGRIMRIHPLADESVPVRDTYIEGAQERTIAVVGHAIAIGYGITVYAPLMIRFLKRVQQA